MGQGPLWAAYKTMTVTRPKVGKQKLITMVTGNLGSNFPAAYNYNFGFPFTTMTVLARNTADLGDLPWRRGWAELHPDPRVPAWTDDYSDLVGAILRQKVGFTRCPGFFDG